MIRYGSLMSNLDVWFSFASFKPFIKSAKAFLSSYNHSSETGMLDLLIIFILK